MGFTSPMYKRFLLPVGMLAGAIIGAGVFALPYVLQPFGVLGAALYLGALGAVFALVHLLYADLVLRAPDNLNFVGIARHYLGSFGFVLTLLTGVFQMFFVLLIYLVLSESFFALLGSALAAPGLVAFWLLGSATVFLSARRFAAVEFLITLLLVLIMVFVFALGFRSGSVVLLQPTAPFPWGLAMLAIAPVLFSLAGRVAVAEVVAYFNRAREAAPHIIRAVVWGTLLPAALYFLFVLAVWALSPEVTHDAVTGLRETVSPNTLALLGVLGLLSLWSSYIIVGLNVKNILRDDLRFPPLAAGALVVFMPLALYGAGFTNFLQLVEFTGGTFLAIEGALLIFLWQRANRESDPVLLRRVPGILLLPLYAIFLLALIGVAVGGII
ncbi:MAG: hypothetical protein HYW56_01610 [Candidatus Harrisonbacteria bacterium]|nr:hypothetical protein [Candidatus Harrisonbacteria bacterium]